MLQTIRETLKELFQIFLLWEAMTITIRFVLFRRIVGKHTLEKAIYRGMKRLIRYSIKGSKKIVLELQQKKQEQLEEEATPDNVIPFKKRA